MRPREGRRPIASRLDSAGRKVWVADEDTLLTVGLGIIGGVVLAEVIHRSRPPVRRVSDDFLRTLERLDVDPEVVDVLRKDAARADAELSV